jgi:arylsulfatase A-like enzyme
MMERNKKIIRIVRLITYPYIPWVYLYLMELPLYRSYWAFGIYEKGVLAFIIPLFIYILFAIIGEIFALVFYPVYRFWCGFRKRPSMGFINWSFIFNIGVIVFLLFSNRIALDFRSSSFLSNSPTVYIILGIIFSIAIISLFLFAMNFRSRDKAARFLGFPLMIVLGIILFLLSTANNSARVLSAERHLKENPNVLILTIDTTNINYMPGYGAADSDAPNLAQLIKRSTLFENTYASVPLTTPSHASIFTGSHPQKHKAYANETRLKYKTQTAAEFFRSEGYITGGFPSAFCVSSVNGFNQGFDYYADRQLGDDIRTSINRYLAPYRFMEIVLGQKVADIALPDNGDAEIANKRFIKWVNKNQDKRWFAWLHYFDLHAPYLPPSEANHERAKYLGNVEVKTDKDTKGTKSASVKALTCLFGEKYFIREGVSPEEFPDNDIAYIKDLYRGEIRHADYALGEVIKTLSDLHILDNTIIAIVGDHGEGLYERGYFGHNYFLNDDETRVPMILYIPEKVWERQTPNSVNQLLRKKYLEEDRDGLLTLTQENRVGQVVESIDLLPTIIDFAGLKIPSKFKHQGKNHAYGESLRGLIEINSELMESWDRPALTQIFIYSRAIRSGDWKLVWGLNNGERVFRYNCDDYHLYNIKDDPGENNNLADIETEKLVEMKGLLELMMVELENKRNFTQIPFNEYLDLKTDADQETLNLLKGLGYLSDADLSIMLSSDWSNEERSGDSSQQDDENCGCRGRDQAEEPELIPDDYTGQV